MKPIHYVQKYKLNESANFDHKEFIQDLTTDFLTLLETGRTASGEFVLAGFENTVRAIRQKWDGISNKTFGVLPENLWKYFYATIICKMREELFPKEMDRRRREKEENEKRWKERRAWEDREFGFSDHFFNFFSFIFSQRVSVPSSSFALLGLVSESTEEDIKSKYRELSKSHHPDKGGNSKSFIEITEAKNKCINYVKNKV